MRKLIAATAVLGFMINGCAWLGFGDDSDTTSAQAETVTKSETSSDITITAPNEPDAPVQAASAAPKTTKGSKGAKSEAQIKAELDQMGRKLAAQSARTLMPNQANKEVKQIGGQWVATYITVDPNRVSTEMRPSKNGQYVGFIRYQERIMECRGASRQAALSAPCNQVRARNLNEMIRYDGHQWQD